MYGVDDCEGDRRIDAHGLLGTVCPDGSRTGSMRLSRVGIRVVPLDMG